MRIRDRLKKNPYIQSGSTNDWNKYKQAGNEVNTLIKHAKEKFYNNLEISISDIYILASSSSLRKNNNDIPPLIKESRNGQIFYFYTDEEKVEYSNDYFSSISTVSDNGVQLPNFEPKTQNSLSNITCTALEISNLIELLNPNKASGPDVISNRMLKAVAIEISVPLEILFNRSFREGMFRNIWKCSHVLSLPKQGDKSVVSNILSGGKITRKNSS